MIKNFSYKILQALLIKCLFYCSVLNKFVLYLFGQNKFQDFHQFDLANEIILFYIIDEKIQKKLNLLDLKQSLSFYKLLSLMIPPKSTS